MATTMVTRDGEVVAVRFFGGSAVGPVVQMEMTEVEWAKWHDVEVSEEGHEHFVNFWDWFAEQSAKCQMRFDNAARQNEQARNFENHRWAGEMGVFHDMASQCRQRARVIARDTMNVAR